MSGGGLLPFSPPNEIRRRYSTDTEKNHAVADYYVNCHPQAEWELLTGELYFKKEFASARESKSFMSTGNYCTMLKLKITFLLINHCSCTILVILSLCQDILGRCGNIHEP